MNFVKVTTKDDDISEINLDNVTSMHPVGRSTLIYFISGSRMTVKGCPDDIIAKAYLRGQG